MNKRLTVFTPVYNRSKIIINLFNSLCDQTVKDFEWIVVDDGSDDNIDEVVKQFMDQKTGIPIRYFKQKHGGKHRAINYALGKAEGEYFFIVDSDDMLTDNAVELILKWIEKIKDRHDIAGVAGLRISKNGIVWGGNPELQGNTFVECSNLDRKKYNLLGDKAEIFKTAILRRSPFPEFEGEYFVTENVCWDAIAHMGYKIRWYNIPIYVCEYLDDGLTKNGANGIDGHMRNYKGYCFYVEQSMHIVPFKDRMYRLYWYNNTRKRMKKSLSDAAKDIKISKDRYCVNLFILMPIAYLLRKLDKLKEMWKKKNGI